MAIAHHIAHDLSMSDSPIRVEAVQLESGTYVQRITNGGRTMLVPPLRDRGQADRLSAELRALLERLRAEGRDQGSAQRRA